MFAPARHALLALTSILMLTQFTPVADPNEVFAQEATPFTPPRSAQPGDPLPPAWLEFGLDGRLLVRILAMGDCPAIEFDGSPEVMTARTASRAALPVIACEATVPFGVRSARVVNQSLPIPDGPFRRIAVIGDTGCRLNVWEGRGSFQACNDPAAWPFAQVAKAVAEWRPDLIIHVGDYLYRESPCPATNAGCAGSPFGDNWATWNADFFRPASILLGSAPWVFMRGNHETCGRNPYGWFAYLDVRPYQPICQKYTEPYVAALNGLSLAIIDSAEAGDETSTPEETAQYARQFELLARIAPAASWLVTHRPVHGILARNSGEFEVENASFQDATAGRIPGHYGLVLSGHIHLAESIAFEPSSGRPPQLISGNAGTALDDIPTASPTTAQLGDPTVEEAETLSSFGFLTLELEGDNWIATQRDATGLPVIGCLLDLPEMVCGPAAEPN